MKTRQLYSRFSRNLIFSVVILAVLSLTFVIYVRAEKQIDRANDVRHALFLLADELRHSSDDLTRLARTYVVTGDALYKMQYQQILDIRDGKKPRPEEYSRIYWDLLLKNAAPPRPDTSLAIPLLELMRRSGFTEEELSQLTESKTNSDRLAQLEKEAMKLVDATDGTVDANRARAQVMLFDERYHQAKAAIMRPIDSFYASVDTRTNQTVHAAKNRALFLRYTLILLTLCMVFMLWRTYRLLHAILGGKLGDIYLLISQLGRGDYSSAITGAASESGNILGWLGETQEHLKAVDLKNSDIVKSLQESEKKYRVLFSESPDANLIIIDGVIVECNHEAEVILRGTREQIIGLHPAALSPDFQPDGHNSAEAAAERIAEALRTGKNKFEWEHRRLDGSVFFVDVSLTVLVLDGKEAIFTTWHDITERKQAEILIALDEARLESLLRISQYEYRTLQDLLDFALHEAIQLTGSTIGYLYYYNEQRQEFTLNSWSRGVMRECSITNPQTIYSLDKTGIWGEAVRQRQPIIINDFDAVNPLKKGYPEGHAHLRSFLTIPVICKNEIVAVIGVANKATHYTDADIRQLTLMMDVVWKMAEQARTDTELLATEAKYRNLLESIQLLSAILDVDANITFCNSYFLSLTGWSHDEVIGKNWFDMFVPGNISKKRKITYQDDVLNDHYKHFEGFMVLRDGTQRLIAWDRTPLYDKSGNFAGIAAIGNDITDHRRTEEQLRQSLKMESIGRLAGGVAHDFNNKLTVIMGNAELAKIKLGNPEKTLEYLDEISLAAEHSREITAQLLAFSRQQMIIPKVLNANRIISETHKSLSRLIGENIAFTFSPAENLWNILIDPVQLDQIVMNLAVNARDAMPEGGSFVIETRNVPVSAQVCKTINDCIPGEYVLITFSDTGTGISQETMQHIFEPFFTTKEQGKGTGLGLATIYGIIRQNNGFIDVRNKPDCGVEFSVYLPRHDAPSTEEAKTTTNSFISGKGSILVVEDEAHLCKMLSMFLKELGYTVHEALLPSEALKIVADPALQLDLVLSDVIMPEMNGTALVQLIREIRSAIPVIFVSGYTAESIPQELLDTGITFMQKPYDLKKLSLRIHELLDTR